MSNGDLKGADGKILYCSFPGKSQHEVRKLIAGPRVKISTECVELAEQFKALYLTSCMRVSNSLLWLPRKLPF